ncbi:MAG: inositol monophosphatase [Candidatus Brocadia sinica]|uniref:Inositol-1-monophosphatase n=1 Tax=Candidatus Brocadia sinica JPN1 TaxID=1197129 RepID=A0ABQ0JY81_9BACT|nr:MULTISPECIES: inositol monophosphatase family protein [Brocadia]MCK6467552.1 inositol monophosphatase [Candidatus Brocadia sinica]NOG40550.1 inositol monophosphatase [Planctomycetota bacterium]NUO05133.1 inositol monophosphatase [Candidatus Brocadia sinica]GAN33647.1 inositol-1-monophosphatase [Candidatus Brocadia sinica JPN1]GIK13475.1 MAG: inositol monophosphatase [Candidatus Brocadia sinica]
MTTNPHDLNTYLEVAREAALHAGVILKEHFGKVCPSMIDEKAKNDYVTDVDKKSEEIIKGHIKSHFNNHGILAEESLEEKNTSAFLWIIDPLDGTLNYIHGLPNFAISIALEIEGNLAVGLIYDPLRENTYSAMKGHGSFKNNKRIQVSHSKTLNTSLIATGFPYRIKDIIDPYLKVFKDFFMCATGIRRGGSACLDLAYTAEDIFGGFFECALSPWDMAAGALLVEEAGGMVTDFKGNDQYLKTGNIIAGSKGVHHEMLEIIQKTFKK